MANLGGRLIEKYINALAVIGGYRSNKSITLGGTAGLDMSASSGTFKTPTGATTLNGSTTTATGKTTDTVDADAAKVAGVILPQELEITMHAQAASDMVDRSFFVANQAYQVTKVKFVHAVAESTAATLLAQVTKDTSTNAPGAGVDLLTNNTNTGFNCKSTANTVQNGTLTATAADLVLAAGDRLSVDFSAAATELVGVTIVVSLKRV